MSLDSYYNKVRDFQRMLQRGYSPDTPVHVSNDYLANRIEHLSEEIDELEDAATWEDKADAIIDLIYVAYGIAVNMGIPQECFNAVHVANMMKEPKSTARTDFDAVKPETWRAPDHNVVLKALGVESIGCNLLYP